jgi:glycine cleavage system H protein
MATSIPEDLRYSDSHEWARQDGEEVVVGITDFAQDQLGDVIYVELPQVGRQLAQHEAFGAVDSVKTYSELFSPLSGEVTAVNTALAQTPELVNSSPYGDGWMLRLRPSTPADWDGLLDATAYEQLTAQA